MLKIFYDTIMPQWVNIKSKFTDSKEFFIFFDYMNILILIISLDDTHKHIFSLTFLNF